MNPFATIASLWIWFKWHNFKNHITLSFHDWGYITSTKLISLIQQGLMAKDFPLPTLVLRKVCLLVNRICISVLIWLKKYQEFACKRLQKIKLNLFLYQTHSEETFEAHEQGNSVLTGWKRSFGDRWVQSIYQNRMNNNTLDNGGCFWH